jgi:endo-1,4-beta-xylanase
MNVDIIQCQPWKLGDNTAWELVEVERQEAGVALPAITSLAQNYPNPFNAATKISYDLATSGNVSLKVYDISGRLVETLVDCYQEVGSHTASWDASGVSSGVYFYKLSTADYTCTKKMNLLR